jgi:(4S)-4-hydroxy-5-phosphonooxypentane-2,3-dione isomerase
MPRRRTVSKFKVLGSVAFVAGAREQLLAILSAHRTRSLADEPGTLAFEVLVPREHDTTLYVYEEYTDEEAFQTHLNGSSFGRVVTEAAGIITELKTGRVTDLDPTLPTTV